MFDGIQEKYITINSTDVVKPFVIKSLRKSNIRKKIAEYLFDIYPNGSYILEISYNVKTSPTNVIGALRGMGTRYKHDESLLSLNIVEKINDSRQYRKLYRLTDFGKKTLVLTKDKDIADLI